MGQTEQAQAARDGAVVFVAMELSKTTWLLAAQASPRGKTSSHKLDGGIANLMLSTRNELAGANWADVGRPHHLPWPPVPGRGDQPSCPFSRVLDVIIHPESVGLVDLADAGMRGGGRALSDG